MCFEKLLILAVAFSGFSQCTLSLREHQVRFLDNEDTPGSRSVLALGGTAQELMKNGRSRPVESFTVFSNDSGSKGMSRGMTTGDDGEQLESEEFSDVGVPRSELELIQAFFYVRHGASCDENFFYEGEWEPYKIKYGKDSNIESLTVLGEAQCWSVGRKLAREYSDFFSGVVANKDYVFHIVKLKKNRICSNDIWFGINDYVPFVGLFSDGGIAEETVKEKGRCYHCDSDSSFPYDISQEYSETTSNESEKPENVLTHKRQFIDLDNYCRRVDNLLFQNTPNIPLSDVALLKKVSPYFRSQDEVDPHQAVIMIFKHLNHNLPLEHGLEKLSKALIMRALKEKDLNGQLYLKEVLNVKDNHWTYLAVYARLLLKNLKSSLESENVRANFYVLHNNNIFSLLGFFIGTKHQLPIYIPNYGSRLVLEVYRHVQTGEKCVRLVWNDEVLEIRGCGSLCKHEKFIDLLETYIELGGNLKEFCEEDHLFSDSSSDWTMSSSSSEL